MILTDSSAAEVGTSNVSAIASATAAFRYFHIYPGVVSYNQPISGTNGLVKTGDGTLQTGQIFNYTGQTQINDGDIEISSASTLNGVISGAGSLKKTGTAVLTIGGNNTYSGGTTFNGGSIIFNSNAFGTGTFVSAAGGILQSSVGTPTLPNDFVLTSGTLNLRSSGANTITISGNISGAGNLNKGGNGFLNLYGTLTYTGSTNIQAGFIRAKKTVSASTATAAFQYNGISLGVSFDVAPPSGTTTFRFFQGVTNQTYAAVTLVGLPVGSTATYTSATSTLAVTVP